jgi:hemerythrin-like domain-containing protein
MDIFEELTSDQRLISRVLEAFDHFLSESDPCSELDLVELNRFTVFLREFVELCHHEREEHILLPAMETIGYAHNSAPLKHIREEHERERNLLLELRRAAVRLRPPAAMERARLVKIARDLIAFEHAHMRKESELLYPSAKKELAGRTLLDLSRSLGTQEGTWSRMVEQTWLRSLADELVRDHGPEASRAVGIGGQ